MADQVGTTGTSAPATQTVAAGGLLDTILQKGKLVRDPSQENYAIDMVGAFVKQVLSAGGTVSNDAVAFINQQIQQLDQLLGDQLDLILHNPKMQALEGSWRGLNYLVMNSETGTHLKIRLMNASKQEVADDLEKAVEFDQSTLFKKIYEEEYGTFGGSPYSCLVADYYFSANPPDMEILSKLSNVAAAAHAPLITAPDPTMFNLDGFYDLGKPRDLAKLFDSADKIKWQSFRETEDSRYVVMTLPRVLMRMPYGPNSLPVEGLNYEEKVDGATQSTFVWGNACYMLGQRITNAYSLYGWTAAIRGVEGGGLVEDLPTYTFHTTDGDLALKCPTEIAITDRREKELSDLGFVALCHCKGTDKAAFFGGQTAQKPKTYNTPDANSNSQISARVPYLLAASRFAHYIKSIMRDKIGSFMTKDEVKTYLQTWISNYVLLNDNAPQEVKARYPLREARVDVFDVPGEPGYYRATVFLRPHFQLEDLTASIRLVANLPKAAG
jgi:type VI secretion system protein ImpC